MFAEQLFSEKIVLVTGGRSGIGFEIAKSFLTYGATVFIASRKKNQLHKAAKKLNEYGPCYPHACDIRKPKEIEVLSAFIQKEKGRLDILINNAGGQFPAPAHVMAEKGWAAVINNNLNGPFFVSQKMANTFFVPQKSGRIVNITANVKNGFPGMAHTGAARAGVENMTKTLGQEWAAFGIRVNAVAPGTIATTGLDQYPQMIKDHFKEQEKQHPMKRFGTAQEVANAVLFLSSPLADYISGVTLAVDGLEQYSSNRMQLYKSMMDLL